MLTKLAIMIIFATGQNAGESTDKKAKDSGPKVPGEVKQMQGTFAGEWSNFSYKDGKTVERMTWTDTMVCGGPLLVGAKAVVNFNSKSVFADQKYPRERSWKEGYFLTEDGGLDERYVEYFNKVTRLKQVSDTTWVYSLPMASVEFKQMGFDQAIRGEHIVIMVDRPESGVDTRRLTRITSVVHTDKDGKETTTQFVSLQGFHKRTE